MGIGIAANKAPPGMQINNGNKTFIINFRGKTEKSVDGIHTYHIDAETLILYLKDENGSIVAAFLEWSYFVIKDK